MARGQADYSEFLSNRGPGPSPEDLASWWGTEGTWREDPNQQQWIPVAGAAPLKQFVTLDGNEFARVGNEFSGFSLKGIPVTDNAQYGKLVPADLYRIEEEAQRRRNASDPWHGSLPFTMALSAFAGPLIGAATAGTSITGSALGDAALKKAAMGAITSGISGGNPLTGAVSGAVSGAAGSALSGGLSSFNANPFDVSNAGTGATLSSVNPLAELRGGSMGDDFDLGSLFSDPTDTQLQQLWAQELGALTPGGQIDWAAIDRQINDPSSSIYMGATGGESFDPGGSLGGLSGLSSGLSKLLGLSSGTGLSGSAGNLWDRLTGNASLNDALSLGARLAPGLGALAFAQGQGAVDTSPISNLVGNSAGVFNSPLDTSRLSSLFSQAGDITNRNTASALQNFDTRTAQARGNLTSGLERRGVMGSSFGNMDIGNFDTQSQNQRGMLEGQLGLQGIAAQSGLANNLLGAESTQRQQQLGYLGQQSNVASQLVNSQLQQKAIQSALFGRAFDVLGRAVAPPSTTIFGR